MKQTYVEAGGTYTLSKSEQTADFDTNINAICRSPLALVVTLAVMALYCRAIRRI